MESFDYVIVERIRSHRSWVNFWNAARKELGLSYFFGTPKVEASSSSRLKKAMYDSNMTAAQIMHEIERRGLV